MHFSINYMTVTHIENFSTNFFLKVLNRSKVQLPFCLIDIVGGEVQFGPLCTAATNRPIVPAPGDYDDGEIGGMMTGRRKRSTRRKPATVPLCPP
jgi:hypothetical protein